MSAWRRRECVDSNGETAMHAAAYKNLPKVVNFLAAGYRHGNFKPSAETEAAVREVMVAAGVTPPRTVVAKTQQIS